MTTTIEKTSASTEEKPRRGARGIQILDIEGNKTKAIVPTNPFKFLTAVLKENVRPTDWTGIEEYEKIPNVYEVPKSAGHLAVTKESRGFLTQSAKKNLENSGVIKTIRKGNPSKASVFVLLVDEFEMKAGHQGSRGTNSTPIKRTPRVKSEITKVSKTNTLNSTEYKLFLKIQEQISACKKQFPELYKMFVEPNLVA